MSRITIARAIAALVLALALAVIACAAVIAARSWTKPSRPWPDGAEQALSASASSSSPSPALLIDYHHRPWALAGATGYFTFTDSEWRALTDRWPTSAYGFVPLPQGPVLRTDDLTLATITNREPASARSSRVWFFDR